MKEYVVINDEGNIGLAVKLMAFDSPDEEIMEKTDLGKIVWLPMKNDYWGVTTSESQPWILVNSEMFSSKLEVLCEI